jgi:hypothetical protein
MGDSMSTIINATTTNGVVIQPDNSGSLQLATNNGTTAVTIDTSQNVGIGTASPISGRALTLNNASNYYGIRFQVGGTSIAQLIQETTGFFYIDSNMNNESGGTIFRTGATERMRIDSSGNVLIGNTSFTSLGQLNVQSATSKDGAVFQSSATGDTTQILFRNPNGVIGKISTLNSATSYVTSSDYRLKENIVPMTGALDTVAALKPVTYKWKVDGSDGQGFIAHELQAVLPDAVVGEKDAVDAEGNPQYQGVDTSFLVATLTAAIQEQQTIINDLKVRVETLEAK